MAEKSADAFRTISEVADWLGTPTHVLRFWESKFSQVKPVKRAGGRRYYRPADMQLLGGIKKLLHEDGMTIKGAQKLLRENGIRYVAAMSPPLDEDLERLVEPMTAGQVKDHTAPLPDAPEPENARPHSGDVLPFATRERAETHEDARSPIHPTAEPFETPPPDADDTKSQPAAEAAPEPIAQDRENGDAEAFSGRGSPDMTAGDPETSDSVAATDTDTPASQSAPGVEPLPSDPDPVETDPRTADLVEPEGSAAEMTAAHPSDAEQEAAMPAADIIENMRRAAAEVAEAQPNSRQTPPKAGLLRLLAERSGPAPDPEALAPLATRLAVLRDRMAAGTAR